LKIIQQSIKGSLVKKNTVQSIILCEVGGGMAYATSIQAQFMKIKTHDIIQYFKKHVEDLNC